MSLPVLEETVSSGELEIRPAEDAGGHSWNRTEKKTAPGGAGDRSGEPVVSGLFAAIDR